MAQVTITGEYFIGNVPSRSIASFRPIDPTTGHALEPAFSAADEAAVDRACTLAWSVFDRFRETESGARARFLEAIAEQILGLGDVLLERAHAESGLPLARLTTERGRTVAQLRLFADELRKGGWLGVRVDPALPERKPLPRSDLRLRKIPVGPVAVFGASNFPLAFSVAGGDTAAALAAGCPVIVKGHPAHPATSELVARAIVAAVAACGLPSGVFSLLNGDSHALGAALVAHPYIKAAAFTGSRAGGLALLQIANQRPEPIPVYAEMSSINPVILLPGALAQRAEALARQFVASLTLGVGQFCTNPGLILALQSADLERFISAAGTALAQVVPAVMLTPGIHASYEKGVTALTEHAHVNVVARGGEAVGCHLGRGALFSIAARDLLLHEELAAELFGPTSLIVRCDGEVELIHVLERLEAQLTATLQMTESDAAFAARLVPLLERKAGRLIANGWPTGVEVSHAMVHGGPFPATSDGRSTSVGTLAIERFLRPVCYQDFPAALLPAALQDELFVLQPHRLHGAYRAKD